MNNGAMAKLHLPGIEQLFRKEKSMKFTRDQILAMTAGKELDRKVAELLSVSMAMFEFGYEAGNYNYSTDIAQAYEVEEYIYEISPEVGREYTKELIDLVDYHGRWSLTMLSKLIRATPEQRAKAALLAVME